VAFTKDSKQHCKLQHSDNVETKRKKINGNNMESSDKKTETEVGISDKKSEEEAEYIDC